MSSKSVERMAKAEHPGVEDERQRWRMMGWNMKGKRVAKAEHPGAEELWQSQRPMRQHLNSNSRALWGEIRVAEVQGAGRKSQDWLRGGIKVEGKIEVV